MELLPTAIRLLVLGTGPLDTSQFHMGQKLLLHSSICAVKQVQQRIQISQPILISVELAMEFGQAVRLHHSLTVNVPMWK
jgi:hypothetical protein